MFSYVLEFLRCGRLMIPEDCKDFELLESEADFYQLTDFIKAVQAKNPKRYHGYGRKDDISKEEGLVIQLKVTHSTSYIQIFGQMDALCELQSIISPL